MGEFLFQIRGPRGSRRFSRPNLFHREGRELLWDTAWDGAAAIDWKIGISGINIPNDEDRRPDHLGTPSHPEATPEYLVLDEDTTYADLLELLSHDGGAADYLADGQHARLMGFDRRTVTFSVAAANGEAQAVASVAEFANAIDWEPEPNPETLGAPGWMIPDWYYLAPSAAIVSPQPKGGFPWSKPYRYTGRFMPDDSGWAAADADGGDGHYILTDTSKSWTVNEWAGYAVWCHATKYTIASNTATALHLNESSFNDHDDVDHAYAIRPDSTTIEEMEAEAWRTCSLPVRAAYLIADGETPVLVASCVLASDVRIAPLETLEVAYRVRCRRWREGIDG